MKIPKIKYLKNGKPNKASKEKIKAFVKENFATLKGAVLPPEFIAKYNQVASGKKRGELNKQRLRNPENGHMLNSAESLAIKNAVKNYAINKGIDKAEVFAKKDLYRKVFDAEIKNEVTITKDPDLIIDILKRGHFKEITITDQNGKSKKVSIEKAAFLLATTKQKLTELFQADKFASYHKITYKELATKLDIFIPNFKGLSPEEIEDLINELEEDFGAFGS
jgi:hypothetical protein